MKSVNVRVVAGVSQSGLTWARKVNARWIYLGKAVGPRESVESALGTAARLNTDGQLRDIAFELKHPFLDFVAEVGAVQTDLLGWWSSSFCWKNWGASDLFLLICYLRLVERPIADAADGDQPLLVLVEDPWLFRELRSRHSNRSDMTFSRAPSLLLWKIRAMGAGGFRRMGWLIDTLRRYWKQRSVWVVQQDSAQGPRVGIYSYPMASCLGPDGTWKDSFLPGLDCFLEDAGYRVLRFSPPERGGFEQELAERSRYFRPAILCATPARIWRSWRAFWRPVWPRELQVRGIGVKYLAEREWWAELARTSQCGFRFDYECLKALLVRERWDCLVYPYENQPWEKLAAHGAQEIGIRSIGVQHSTLATLFVSYFLGQGESDRVPLPDTILTSGPYPHKLLLDGGINDRNLKMCGSLRYGHLSVDRANLPTAMLEHVLVALPIDIHMANHMISAIRRAWRNGAIPEEVRFQIKAHPTRQIKTNELGFPAKAARGSIMEAFEQCGTVVFVGSTVGSEAIALGRAVLRYSPDLLLDVDPSEAYGEEIPACTDSDFGVRLSDVVRGRVTVPAARRIEQITGELFAPLDRSALAEVFEATPMAVSH